jgi:putative transposase
VLVADALRMAVAAGLLHHGDRGDRGSQYADYRRLLAARGIGCGTSGRGDRRGDAPTESVRATLKGALVDRRDYATRDEARASTFEHVGVFYNRQRMHSSLDHVSPEQFEAGLKQPAPSAHRSWGSPARRSDVESLPRRPTPRHA